MEIDDLAFVLAQSLAEHQTRGLVDGANGMGDVVIHGRVNLLGVAEDLRNVLAETTAPARRSWAKWFVRAAERRRQSRQKEIIREALLGRLKTLSQQAVDHRAV